MKLTLYELFKGSKPNIYHFWMQMFYFKQ